MIDLPAGVRAAVEEALWAAKEKKKDGADAAVTEAHMALIKQLSARGLHIVHRGVQCEACSGTGRCPACGGDGNVSATAARSELPSRLFTHVEDNYVGEPYIQKFKKS